MWFFWEINNVDEVMIRSFEREIGVSALYQHMESVGSTRFGTAAWSSEADCAFTPFGLPADAVPPVEGGDKWPRVIVEVQYEVLLTKQGEFERKTGESYYKSKSLAWSRNIGANRDYPSCLRQVVFVYIMTVLELQGMYQC